MVETYIFHNGEGKEISITGEDLERLKKDIKVLDTIKIPSPELGEDVYFLKDILQ